MRDYIHVVDLAKGHLAALNRLAKPGFEVYNLGTGNATTVLQLVNAFKSISGWLFQKHTIKKLLFVEFLIFRNVSKFQIKAFKSHTNWLTGGQVMWLGYGAHRQRQHLN